MSGLSPRAGNKKAKMAVRGVDLYETPPAAIRALMSVEPLPVGVWEPACGPGSIVRELRAGGHAVHASDLIDYQSVDQDVAHWDFLEALEAPPGAQAIVTNPPYHLAAEFVRKALELVPLTAMLLRLPFLEGKGRSDILEGGKLARVHVFRGRLPMMHRSGWNGKTAANSMAFAWFVWDTNHRGPTELHRLSWEVFA